MGTQAGLGHRSAYAIEPQAIESATTPFSSPFPRTSPMSSIILERPYAFDNPCLPGRSKGVSSRDARTSVTLAYRGKQPLETRQAPGRSLDPVPVFGAGRLRRPSPSPSPHRPVSRAVENALSGLAHLFQLGAVLHGFRSSFRRARRTGDAVSRWTAEAACGLRALGGRFAASPDVGGARFAATLRPDRRAEKV